MMLITGMFVCYYAVNAKVGYLSLAPNCRHLPDREELFDDRNYHHFWQVLGSYMISAAPICKFLAASTWFAVTEVDQIALYLWALIERGKADYVLPRLDTIIRLWEVRISELLRRGRSKENKHPHDSCIHLLPWCRKYGRMSPFCLHIERWMDPGPLKKRMNWTNIISLQWIWIAHELLHSALHSFILNEWARYKLESRAAI